MSATVLSDRREHFPNCPQTSKSRSHKDQLPGRVLVSHLVHPRLVVPGRPSSAGLLLPAPPLVLRATVTIGHMSPIGFHSVTIAMSLLTAVATTIALHGLLRLALSGLGRGTVHGIGHRSDLIAVSADGLALPALLALPMRAIGGIEALVQDREVTTKGKQTSQCPAGHHEMCRRYRFLCWKRSIGKFAHIPWSLLGIKLIFREGTSFSMWRMPFATVVCG